MNAGVRGAWKLSWGVALAGVALSALTMVARADAPKDPYSVDILGFRLGMSPDEIKSTAAAKIESPVFEVKQGALTSGTYTSSQMVFGVEVSAGRDAHTPLPAPDQEVLYFIFDTRSPFKTTEIRRKRAYSPGTAPVLQQLLDSLTEKYGKPTAVDTFSGQTTLIWAYNPAFTYKTGDMSTTTCRNQMIELDFQYYGRFQGNPNPNFAKCGTWMTAVIKPLRTNPQLTGEIEIAIKDITASRESNLFVNDLLAKGAAGTSGNEIKKAPKPTL